MIRTPIERHPLPQTARIDLSRVPSSMEDLAAGWAAAAAGKHAAGQADKQRRRKKPEPRP